MIERDEDVGATTLRCDDCGELMDGDFNADAFQTMIDTAKAEGWTVRPDGDGGWRHTCGCDLGSKRRPGAARKTSRTGAPDRIARQRKLLGL